MNLLKMGVFALLLIGSARVASAEIVVQKTENGVICEPSGLDDVIEDRFVRVPADPSQPDINPLPTSPLSIGTFALSPDIPAKERTKIGYKPYSACRPEPAPPKAPLPKTQPWPRG